MRTVKLLKGCAPMLALALLGSGCAGTAGTSGTAGSVKLSSAKMCAAHGGTFNAAAKTCTYTPSTRSAQQVCQAHDGYYDTAADICSFNP